MGYGLFLESMSGVWALLTIIAFLLIGFVGAPLLAWTIAAYVAMWLWGVSTTWMVVLAIPFVIFNLPPLRQALITTPVVALLKKLEFMPVISETERVALEAGTTWIDKDLFSGRPDFRKILQEPYDKLGGDEKAFVEKQVATVCSMVSDWDVFKAGDLPKEVWDYLKKEKFFGMIIPKEYGGLGFSPIANSEVVAQLSSRSMTLAVSVMVPNSLGPAELLVHYGTEEQKKHYLPRLASGEYLPCFALTEPEAGSDAGSISSTAVVFKGDDGKLYLRLNWEKRYITLAAIANVIGLAVQLKDPEGLLGKGKSPGITCVLVPSTAQGVILGERHNPMGVPFYNCPTRGKDVVISLDHVIGGANGVGRGWQMLMECLAAGRAISLPAQTTGGAKAIARITSAYALFRKQFGISIGKFEGVEEPLARIAGLSYLMEAARLFTVNAVNKGIKPSVVSAIAKYNSTELGRKLTLDGMDILGGAAISRGPRNLLANAYIATPISITVEGANILTRSMIIFGQGAIRCHPYAYGELKALADGNIKAFDRDFWSHVGFVVRNLCRSILLSLTRGHLAANPGGPVAHWYRKLSWSSASFAIMADMALGIYGGGLKFREKITGRYADILSWMYLATCTLRRFEAEGRQAEHLPFVEWSMHYAFSRIQEAFDGIFGNFENPLVRWFFAGPIRLWSQLNRFSREPNDREGATIVHRMLSPGAVRDAVTEGIYQPTAAHEQMALYEKTFLLVAAADGINKKIHDAIKSKRMEKSRGKQAIKNALAAGVITAQEAETLENSEKVRLEAIQVDAFKLSEFRSYLLEPAKTQA